MTVLRGWARSVDHNPPKQGINPPPGPRARAAAGRSAGAVPPGFASVARHDATHPLPGRRAAGALALVVFAAAAAVSAESPRAPPPRARRLDPRIVGGIEVDPSRQVPLHRRPGVRLEPGHLLGPVLRRHADRPVVGAHRRPLRLASPRPTSASEIDVVVGRHDLRLRHRRGAHRGRRHLSGTPATTTPRWPTTWPCCAWSSAATAGSPLALATAADAGLFEAGDPATVIGWGSTQGNPPGTPNYPDTLREVEVPIVSDADCTAAYGSDFILPDQICAGDLVNGGHRLVLRRQRRPAVRGHRAAATCTWASCPPATSAPCRASPASTPAPPPTPTGCTASWRTTPCRPATAATATLLGSARRRPPPGHRGRRRHRRPVGCRHHLRPRRRRPDLRRPGERLGRCRRRVRHGRRRRRRATTSWAAWATTSWAATRGATALLGGDGIDLLFGSTGNDVVLGDAGNDLIYGGDGADRLYGGDGADTIVGFSGDDTLSGGPGGDKLVGIGGLRPAARRPRASTPASAARMSSARS